MGYICSLNSKSFNNNKEQYCKYSVLSGECFTGIFLKTFPLYLQHYKQVFRYIHSYGNCESKELLLLLKCKFLYC